MKINLSMWPAVFSNAQIDNPYQQKSLEYYNILTVSAYVRGCAQWRN